MRITQAETTVTVGSERGGKARSIRVEIYEGDILKGPDWSEKVKLTAGAFQVNGVELWHYVSQSSDRVFLGDVIGPRYGSSSSFSSFSILGSMLQKSVRALYSVINL